MLERAGGTRRRALWVISGHRNDWTDVLVLDRDGDGSCLPVFSHREEAETFLRLRGSDGGDGLRIKETAAGELVSVLFGPCACVRSVALDPLPEAGPGFKLHARMDRERFVGNLISRRGAGLFPGDDPRAMPIDIPDYVVLDFGLEGVAESRAESRRGSAKGRGGP